MLAGSEETASIVGRVLTILLVVVAPIAILKRLVEHPVISLNTFYGAVCVYLLIAMFFATTYGLIALVSGEQFFAQLTVTPQDTPAVDYLYFSFVTITTTGYGDFSAATGFGRMTAVLEAIFGQLYLITVVALVVQNLGQQSRLGRRMEEEQAGRSRRRKRGASRTASGRPAHRGRTRTPEESPSDSRTRLTRLLTGPACGGTPETSRRAPWRRPPPRSRRLLRGRRGVVEDDDLCGRWP